jgi:hypothetical protein
MDRSMRNDIFLFFLAALLTACTQDGGTERINSNQEKRTRKKVISIAENYALKQLKNGKKDVAKNGFIILRDSQKIIVIDPAKIFIGLVDYDSNEDAIVSIDTYHGNTLALTEHLIILKTKGKFMLVRTIESDMKILGIKDGVINAEVHTRPRSSPLYNCSECMEVVKYRFKDGDLVRI